MSDSIIIERQPLQAAATAGVLRRRLYIFPTQHGLVYGCMLAVMLLGAINYSNSMAYMLTFMLVSLYMVSMLHTYRNLRGLVICTGDARPVFAGEVADFPVVFDNRSGLRRTSVHIHQRPARRRLQRYRSEGVEYTLIEAGQLYRDTLTIPAGTRGRLRPGRLRIHSSWPIGLFRAWSYMECRSTCIVYPQPAGDAVLPYHTEDYAQDQIGEQTGADDFTGFRPYRSGDSIRNIDWKILAREQGLLVKRFCGSGARRLILTFEQTGHITDIETRLSQLALWVLLAEQAGLRYGLVMPAGEIGLGNGETHRHECLYLLATHGQNDAN